MRRTHCVKVRACSWPAGHIGAWAIGLAVVWMVSAPRPVRGQSAVWLPQNATTGNIYYNGGNVGIGTSGPTVLLDTAGPGRYSNWWTPGAGAGLELGYLSTYGSGSSFINSYDRTASIAKDLNLTAATYIFNGGNVGIGTGNPQYKLSVNGTIGAKDVVVTNTGWSDYVFRPGYRLRPLSEVSAYIQAHHHLPGIPSEAEVKQKGVSVGEMQAKLLAKVEELTLHMIQQEKENRELRERIAQLENRAAGR